MATAETPRGPATQIPKRCDRGVAAYLVQSECRTLDPVKLPHSRPMTWRKTKAVSLVVRKPSVPDIGSCWQMYENSSYPLVSDLEGASRFPGPPFAAIAQINIPIMVVMQVQNETRKNLLSLYGGVVSIATNTTQ